MTTETTDKPYIFYKYKSLNKTNFKFFIDIILNNRLHASIYKKMNDKMEGEYYGWIGEETFHDKLKEGKNELKICSLGSSNDNPTLWEKYANKKRGIAIGVIIGETYKIEPIQYVDESPFISINNPNFQQQDIKQTAEYILSHKLKKWESEKEWRVFVEDCNDYVDVKVIEIIIGIKMDETDHNLIKRLVEKINPDIKVKKQE